jgi:hypothetical protein
MDAGVASWFIMTAGGATLLGTALAYELISTRKRRENPVAQRLTDTATREIYDEEEDARRRKAGSAPLEDLQLNITKARQGVTGHGGSVVLSASLMLAFVAGIALLVFALHLRG